MGWNLNSTAKATTEKITAHEKELSLLPNFLVLRAEQTLYHPANEKTKVLAEDKNFLLARFQSYSLYTHCTT